VVLWSVVSVGLYVITILNVYYRLLVRFAANSHAHVHA
jgi:hypothetical protein